MADRIQQRRDTAARWAQYNPVLLEGEVGYVTDNPNQYKIGDGIHAWNDLPLRGYTGTIVQDTGYDENVVMSQKATTDKLTELERMLPFFSSNNNLVQLYKKGYINSYEGKIVEDEGSKYVIIPVQEGDKFYYKCDINGLDLNCFFEADFSFLADSRFIIKLGEQTIEVPVGASYMGITVEYTSMGEKRGDINNQFLYKSNDKMNEISIGAKNNVDSLIPIDVTLEDGFYYKVGSGEKKVYENAKGTSQYYKITDLCKYVFTGRVMYEVAACVFYDKDKKVLSTYPKTSSSINDRLVKFDITKEIPYGAEYVRFSVYHEPSDESNIDREAIFSGSKSVLYGKKWVAVGDSLTEKNIRSTKNYHDYVAEETGINVVNFGVSGSGYKNPTDDGDQEFYKRINNIPTDADVVTIFGSGNDLSYDIGDINDETADTICGCVNLAIKNALTRIPTCKLGIVTPTPWWTYTPDKADNKMMQMCEAIKKVAMKWSIPVLDLYYSSNLHPNIEACRNATYSRDDGGGVHPDENGHKIIANRFRAFLEEIV